MRYSAAVASVLLFALCAVTCGAAAAESGDFTEWARKQSDECDRNWNNFVQSHPRGPMKAPVQFDNAGRTTPAHAAAKPSGWNFKHKGYIHKAELPFMPMSTTERSGATRGVSRLDSPAKARLSVPHSRRRPVNSRTQFKSSLRRRGGTTRLSVKSGHRLSSSRRRRRTASRRATRTRRRR
jgi:hypothetical protein